MGLVNAYLSKKSDASPVAVFRIFFGLVMVISLIRFWVNGWIEKFYLEPKIFFSYYGFEWVKPIGTFTYLIFVICGISSVLILIGYRYRLAITIFFLSFTYIEFMDKTTYLNHYYFISILSFLMFFLPAGKYFSVDARKESLEFIPKWCVDSIKLLLSIVYLYAGIAKLNSDWLIDAMPLKIWLPGKYDIPIIGDFLHLEWVIYALSWGGAIYDISIPFLLFWKRTRTIAFVLVILFHILTGVLFPIGMFPYIMIVGALVFFDVGFHQRILAFISSVLRIKTTFNSGKSFEGIRSWERIFLIVFFTLQLLFPWRYLMYPGELFWHEQGFRFSWRVMLMEKAGYANFKVVTGDGSRFYVDNSNFLTPFQEKQMASHPDFILQYAGFLKDHFEQQEYEDIEVYVESYVALNGRKSQLYIDPCVNLADIKESFRVKTWILPFKDEIKGF